MDILQRLIRTHPFAKADIERLRHQEGWAWSEIVKSYRVLLAKLAVV